jgi:hypothetical protein
MQKLHAFFRPSVLGKPCDCQKSTVNSSHFVAAIFFQEWHANCSVIGLTNPLGICNGNGFADPTELQVSPPAKEGAVIQMMPPNHPLPAPPNKMIFLSTCWQQQQRRFFYV